MSIEVLKQLLENDVLTEDTKQSIQSAFVTIISEAKEVALTEAKGQAEQEYQQKLTEAEELLKANYTTQLTEARQLLEEEIANKMAQEYVRDRDSLIESVDTLVTNAIQEHIASHEADFNSFRDVEAEAAKVVVEAKRDLIEQSKTDLKALVEQLDVFLDRVVEREFEQLRDDLIENQRAAVGLKMFEGFRQEFEQLYLHETGVAGQLSRLKSQLAVSQAEKTQLEESLQKTTRSKEMLTVLAPLQGKPRQVMETILSTVATAQLQETYDRFVGRVLTEHVSTAQGSLNEGKRSEKETKVLAEGKLDLNSGVIKTGNTQQKPGVQVVKEHKGLTDEEKRSLMRASGLL